MHPPNHFIPTLALAIAACTLAGCGDDSSNASSPSCDESLKSDASCTCNDSTGQWENCHTDKTCDVAKPDESCTCDTETGNWKCPKSCDGAKPDESCTCDTETGNWKCPKTCDGAKPDESCTCDTETGNWKCTNTCNPEDKTSEDCTCDDTEGRWICTKTCNPDEKTSDDCTCDTQTNKWKCPKACNPDDKTDDDCTCDTETGTWNCPKECNPDNKTSGYCTCNLATGEWENCDQTPTPCDPDSIPTDKHNCICNATSGNWQCEGESPCEGKPLPDNALICSCAGDEWVECSYKEIDKCEDVNCLTGQNCNSENGECEYTDAPALIIKTSANEVTEGSAISATFSLSAEPSEDVTLTLALSGEGKDNVQLTENGIAKTEITIPKENWQQGITLQLSAIRDYIVDYDKSLTLSASSTSSQSEFNALSKQADLTVKNIDTAEIKVVAPTERYTNEDGTKEASFGITLTSKPFQNVTVPVSLSPATYAKIKSGATDIVFTPENWSKTQNLVIVGKDDGNTINPTPNTYQLVFGKAVSNDANFYQITPNPASYTLTNLDNDSPQITGQPVGNLNEGSSASVNLFLSYKPTVNTTLTVTVKSTSLCSLKSGASSTVTPSGWINGTASATFEVTAKDDEIYNPNQKCIVEVKATSSDTNTSTSYNNKSITIEIPVLENDTTGIVHSPTGTQSLCAADSPQTECIIFYESSFVNYIFTTKSKPTSDVNLTFTVQSTYDTTHKYIKLSKTSVTIKPDAFQNTSCGSSVTNCLTVTDIFDYSELNSALFYYKISYTSSSSDPYYNGLKGSFDIDFQDKATRELSDIKYTTKTVYESSSTTPAKISFKAGYKPPETTTCTISSSNTSRLTVSPSSLSITASNWNQDHVISAFAVNDSILNMNNDEATVSITCNPNFAPFKSETITVVDNEVPSIIMSCDHSTLYPTGWYSDRGYNDINDYTRTSCKIRLGTKPSSAVTITLSTTNTNLYNTSTAFNPNKLTFDSSNYNTDQTITFELRKPSSVTNGYPETTTITATSSSSDYAAPKVTKNITTHQLPHYFKYIYQEANKYYSQTLPKGKYRLHAWGAAGGGHNELTSYDTWKCGNHGGAGGYIKGTLTLTSQDTIYVYTGSKGKAQDCDPCKDDFDHGGYNGGGAGRGGGKDRRGYSGGGATDFCIGSTACATLSTHYPYRILVAGGGGGSVDTRSDKCYTTSWDGQDHGGNATYNTSSYYPVEKPNIHNNYANASLCNEDIQYDSYGVIGYWAEGGRASGIFYKESTPDSRRFGKGQGTDDSDCPADSNAWRRGGGGGGWYGGRAHCKNYKDASGGGGANYAFLGSNQGPSGSQNKSYALTNVESNGEYLLPKVPSFYSSHNSLNDTCIEWSTNVVGNLYDGKAIIEVLDY